MGKSSLPLSRRLYSHPRMVTLSPTCWPSSRTVVTVAWVVAVSMFLVAIRSGAVSPHLLTSLSTELKLCPSERSRRVRFRLMSRWLGVQSFVEVRKGLGDAAIDVRLILALDLQQNRRHMGRGAQQRGAFAPINGAFAQPKMIVT